MNINPEFVKVNDLFYDDIEYFIPLYQRDYAWSREQVYQLIDDIAVAAVTDEKDHRSYYLGSLVISERENPESHNLQYEVIDGQQRLITLHLINAYFARKKKRGNQSAVEQENLRPNLVFHKLRDNYNIFFKELYSNKNIDELKLHDSTHTTLLRTYEDIPSIITEVCLNHTNYKEYDKLEESHLEYYMRNYVKILRIPIPSSMDRNRYFQIMNTRGEQLEKHEILKAELMSQLANDEDKFASVWEKCSNYFSQHKESDLSDACISPKLDCNPIIDNISSDASLASIIDGIDKNSQTDDYIPTDSNGSRNFSSTNVVDFQNFLMIALKIYVDRYPNEISSNIQDVHETDTESNSIHITLDDKKLLQSFKKVFRFDDKSVSSQILQFGELLNNLFNTYKTYIIHRIDGRWSISADVLETTIPSNKKRVISLQTLFSSSAPAKNYQYWLYFALREDDKDKLATYSFWENMARHYLSGRYRAIKQDYETIMDDTELEQITDAYLNYDNRPVFALRLYDYLLWVGAVKDFSSDTAEELVFSADHHSIEHFYPQNPNQNSTQDNPQFNQVYLHQFGNLCLITPSMNSRFTNLTPKAKFDEYRNAKHDSIILERYYQQARKGEWDINEQQNTSRFETIYQRIQKNTEDAMNAFNDFLRS